MEWLLANERALIDAEYCLNVDAGDPQIRDGRRLLRPVQTSEKLYQSFTLEVRNPGGHSSQPTPASRRPTSTSGTRTSQARTTRRRPPASSS